jgi:hypothetical protein
LPSPRRNPSPFSASTRLLPLKTSISDDFKPIVRLPEA